MNVKIHPSVKTIEVNWVKVTIKKENLYCILLKTVENFTEMYIIHKYF